MNHHYLFPTLISQFKHISDDTLTNAIENEDMIEKKMTFHSTASVDNKLHEKNEYQTFEIDNYDEWVGKWYAKLEQYYKVTL